MMSRPADARLTPELAREVCERTGSAAVLEGSIAPLGTQYVLWLRARSCRAGDVLFEQQAQAERKEDTLNSLSQIAGKFRARAGEALEREWEEVLRKFERLTPTEFRQVGGQARSSMNRYFAYLAYEAGSYRRALNRLKEGWRASPTGFLVDSRNWLTFPACMSGLLLPSDIHRRLEHLAGLHREWSNAKQSQPD